MFSHIARLVSIAAALMVIGLPQLASAQRGYNNMDGGGILSCLSGIILIPIIIIALNIALLVWVNKDAKSRGMDNSVVWMLVVLLTSFIGLIIYLLSRPKGRMAPCPRCNQVKLAILSRCPHCGAEV